MPASAIVSYSLEQPPVMAAAGKASEQERNLQRDWLITYASTVDS